jgi:hypothetical protein
LVESRLPEWRVCGRKLFRTETEGKKQALSTARPIPDLYAISHSKSLETRPMKRTLLTLAALFVAACDSSAPAPATGDAQPMLSDSVSAAELEADLAKFTPARIDFDADALEPWEKQVIAKLVEASDFLHEIFSEQVSPQNAEWRSRLASATDPAGRAAARYFDIMVGPWDRLNHDRPFLAAGPKPPGAGYYPADMTKEEFDAWLEKHPGDREAFTGYFTVIRRQNDSLVAVPYSEAYGDRLEQAAKLLREAAGLSRNASLSDYLNKRADAFLSNDYYASDLAWMDIEGSRIEPTIGPYGRRRGQRGGASFEQRSAIRCEIGHKRLLPMDRPLIGQSFSDDRLRD